jgi:hypothetical protein
MKTNFLITILVFLCMPGLRAQDIIIKKNGDEINAKVLEAGTTEIKYKRFDNIDGPVYTIDKSDVFMIKYADGTKTIITQMDSPGTSGQAKEMSNEKRIFQKQKSYLSAAYGFGTFLGWGNWDYYNGEQYTSSTTGPVYVKYEYGVTEDFGIGINLAYLEYKYSYKYNSWYNGTQVYFTETDTYTSFSGLLRANWHFGQSEKIDPYYGFGLGYRTGTIKYTSDDPNGSQHNYYGYNFWYWGNGNRFFPVGFETTFGVRIKFSSNVSAFAEAGVAKSAVQFGLTAKF